MNLIDRYVYAVTEYLPEDIRNDVGKELRANIEDMLPENATDNAIHQVLEGLGNPWKLANEYNPRKKYLIGPGYYDTYLSVLKMVIGICVIVFFGLSIFAWIIDAPKNAYPFGSIAQLISQLITAGVEGALQGAFWVTIVFVILERSGVEAGHSFMNKKWSPDDLPEIPLSNKRKISRRKTVASMFCTILFTAIFYFQPQLLAVYHTVDNGSMTVVPLFSIDQLQLYMPFILILALIQLILLIVKYFVGRWNIPLAIGNAVFNVAICILLFVMISDNALLNNDLYTLFHVTISTNLAISAFLNNGIWIFGIVFVIICIWDSISAFLLCANRI